MTKLNVVTAAFAMPGGEGGGRAAGRPIDFAHLERQTFGDRGLETELLSLFVGQAAAIRGRLRGANGEERQRLAHTLKGSARSVGAFALGDAAAVLEMAPGNDLHLRAVEARIDDVADYVATISR